MLLHCYPFIREAGYLAEVYPHVYFDTGAILHYTGSSCRALIAQSLELAPFAKIVFSSDAFGLPELYHLGALAVAARHRRDHVRLGRAGRDQRPGRGPLPARDRARQRGAGVRPGGCVTAGRVPTAGPGAGQPPAGGDRGRATRGHRAAPPDPPRAGPRRARGADRHPHRRGARRPGRALGDPGPAGPHPGRRCQGGLVGTHVAVRTELDALPMTEKTGAPWASVNGAMHACGHDVHMAGLVAFGRALRAVGGPRPVLAVLQPREESSPSGALDVVSRLSWPRSRSARSSRCTCTHRCRPARSRCRVAPVNASSDDLDRHHRGPTRRTPPTRTWAGTRSSPPRARSWPCSTWCRGGSTRCTRRW